MAIPHAQPKLKSIYNVYEHDHFYATIQFIARPSPLATQPSGPYLRAAFLPFVLSRHIASYIIRFQSLDLIRTELRKTARGASLGKPQNLLGFALGTDAHGDYVPFVRMSGVMMSVLPPLGSDTGLLLR